MKKMKLSLNKETISRLNNDEQMLIVGGAPRTFLSLCQTCKTLCVTDCPSQCNTLDNMLSCAAHDTCNGAATCHAAGTCMC